MSNYLTSYELAEAFKALSNPNRVQIFLRLLSCCTPGSACREQDISHFNVGALGEQLDIAPSTLSHHIKELSRAGLIETLRNGQHVECRIQPDKVSQLAQIFRLDQHLSTTE